MKALNKYLAVASVAARSNLAYFGEAASRLLFLAVILYIFMRLWKVTYTETGAAQLGGFSLEQMLWYLAVTESIMLSAPRVALLVDEDVRTGALTLQLVRPLAYPMYRLWTTMGERVVRFAVNGLAASVVAWVLVGPIPWNPLGLLALLVSLPLAFAIDFLGNFLIGLGAFWLEDTSGLVLIYSRITMILGGMLIPLEFFPDAVRPIMQALPFASMVYGPARAFVRPDLAELTVLVVRQGLAVLAFSVLIGLVYRMALRRVFANGG